jgi:hypothetical protein
MVRHIAAAGLALLAVLIGLCVLATALGAMLAPPGARPASPGNCELIGVQRVMLHTEIVLPADAFDPDSPVRALFPEANGYAIGWGDRRAYPGALTVGQAVTALVWPTPSVLHVHALDHPPLEGRQGVTVAVSRQGLEALVREIEAAFVLGEAGRPIHAGRGKRGPRSVFAQARPSYHLLRTCNVWTGARLRAAGAPVGAPAVHLLPWTLTGELNVRAQAGCPGRP